MQKMRISDEDQSAEKKKDVENVVGKAIVM